MNNISWHRWRWAVFIGAYLGDGIRWDSIQKSLIRLLGRADETEVQDLNQIVKIFKCTAS